MSAVQNGVKFNIRTPVVRVEDGAIVAATRLRL